MFSSRSELIGYHLSCLCPLGNSVGDSIPNETRKTWLTQRSGRDWRWLAQEAAAEAVRQQQSLTTRKKQTRSVNCAAIESESSINMLLAELWKFHNAWQTQDKNFREIKIKHNRKYKLSYIKWLWSILLITSENVPFLNVSEDLSSSIFSVIIYSIQMQLW